MNATKPCVFQLAALQTTANKLQRFPSSARKLSNIFGASTDPAPGGSQNRNSTNSPTIDAQEMNPRVTPIFRILSLPGVSSGGDACKCRFNSHDAIDSGDRHAKPMSAKVTLTFIDQIYRVQKHATVSTLRWVAKRTR